MELPQALTRSLGALANIKISLEACHLGSQLLVGLKSKHAGKSVTWPCSPDTVFRAS